MSTQNDSVGSVARLVSPSIGMIAINALLEIRDDLGCEMEEAVKTGKIKEEDWIEFADMCGCRGCRAGRALAAIWRMEPKLAPVTKHDQIAANTKQGGGTSASVEG